MTKEEIYDYIKSENVNNVTLTGGEPLMQDGIYDLLEYLSKDDSLNIEIETNGSIDISRFIRISNRPKFTMDYKLGFSKMQGHMKVDNFKYLTKDDTIKFVSSRSDLETFNSIVKDYELIDKTNVYISPVFGEVEMSEIVEFMKLNNLNGVTLQIQLHKVIWDPELKGV